MGTNNADTSTDHEDVTKLYAIKTIDAFLNENKTENKVDILKMNHTIRNPSVMSGDNPGLYSHKKDETRKEDERISTSSENEVKNSRKYLWKSATVQQSKINETIEKIKEENGSLHEALEHNRIEKRSAVAYLPAHVERFSEPDLVGSDKSSTLATVSLVYIVLGFGVVVIFLAMTVLFPLLFKKYIEKRSKGNSYKSYSVLGGEALSQVVIVNENARVPSSFRKVGMFEANGICGDMDNQPRKRSLEKKKQSVY